jgi:type IV pilus assembly protein PilN
MIRINLLPTEEAERAADQRQQIATLGLVVAVTALGFVMAHTWQAARFATTNHHLSQVTAELQQIAGAYGDVTKMEQQQKVLEEKLKVISQLEARSAGPVRMLADLSTATPDKLWLTDFTETGGQIKMSGFSVDEQTIADFLRRLDTSPYFHGVDLDETTQVTQDGVKEKKFSLKAQVNYAGATPPATTPAPGAKPDGKTAAADGAAAPERTASLGKVTP